MLEDCGARAVVSPGAAARELRHLALPRIVADENLACETGGNLPGETGPECPAYVMYTSGSSAEGLGAAIRAHGVTTAWLTASLFNSIVEEDPRVLAPLRLLLVGGEALSVTHVRRALAALPDTEIRNGYGPTEATTFATTYPIPRTLAEDAVSIPICRPIANTTVYVCSEQGELAPAGVPGELWIGGDGVALGYVNRPELTRTKFVPDRFSGIPGALLYRSGDLVRQRRDGVIEFLGRMDEQVKIRGFRIEPGEIEAAISRLRNVRRCAVVPRLDSAAGKRMVAYIVPEPGATARPSADGIGRALSLMLPDYLLPSAYVFLDRLPMSANGKLDRAALPPPPSAAGQSRRAGPRSVLEMQVQQIWEGVLGMRPIGVFDNFFELGGHSLMALRIVSRLETVLGAPLPVSFAFQAPTIERMARLIARGVAPGRVTFSCRFA